MNSGCEFQGCERPVSAKGLCKGHYLQRWHGRELTPIRHRGPNRGGLCRVAGCSGRHNAHGMCRIHYHIWRTYSIEPEHYEALALQQGGACAICRRACVSGRKLAVDHDHVTGQIRGLLCAKCNRAIGLLSDDPGLLEAAAAYLRGADVISIRKVA